MTNFLNAATWVMSASDDIVGEIQYVNPQMGETLSDAGIRFDIGYYEMVRANPDVDPLRPLSSRTRLLIPSQYVLPEGPRQGIVINLAEYRLYFYPPNDNVVITMPVGIGRKGWSTPVGLTKVTGKARDPVWHPTDNVKAAGEKNGTIVPEAFPGGEGNPLGRHVLRLGWPTYLIHGTNRRDGVGQRVSAGCIRMMPEDIEYLFELVSTGTPVRVINEPVKLGKLQGDIYLEAHPLLDKRHRSNLQSLIARKLAHIAGNKNNKVISKEAALPSGIPRKIS
ncbi:MAG: L,D-transpeptidase family protein [Legionella sp.]|nr:L,D-transpeptidase family protein [Legionella sp.]